jgi:hypothetical protein
LLHVLSEVRHMTEKARDSAVSTVEELDALRRRLSLSQSGAVMAVEMEAPQIPQCLITQPRKKGRPKFTVRGVRDTDLIKSAPSGSATGDDVANNPSSHKGDSKKSSQTEDETATPTPPDRIDVIEVKIPPDPVQNVSTGPTRRHAVTEVKRPSSSVQGEASRPASGIRVTDARTPHDSPEESAAPGAVSGEPASTKVSKTPPKGKKKGERVG